MNNIQKSDLIIQMLKDRGYDSTLAYAYAFGMVSSMLTSDQLDSLIALAQNKSNV